MNPSAICFSGDSITLVFKGMREAAYFLESQSQNKEWLAQWVLTYNTWGTVNATSKHPANVSLIQRFQPGESPVS